MAVLFIPFLQCKIELKVEKDSLSAGGSTWLDMVVCRALSFHFYGTLYQEVRPMLR